MDAARPAPLPLRDALRLTGAAVREQVRADVPGTRRGVALLVVLVTVAVMGALSTEFSYNTRTNIWMAGNVTAETQAYYHARSSLEIATLAVNAKKNFPQMKAALSLMGGQGGASLEIWRQACEFVKIFSTGKASFFGMDILDLSSEEAVGVKKGAFECNVTAEDSRTNLNAASTDPPHVQASRAIRSGVIERGAEGGEEAGDRPPVPAAPGLATPGALNTSRKQLGLKLFGLLRPFLDQGHFDSEDEMLELILNVMDWTDADDNKTDVGQEGQFIESSASEAGDYGKDDYDVKNAKMDTVGEVQLIEGMTSDVYCRIRDKLTVFSTGKLNVNDADLGSLMGVLCQSLPEDQRLLLCWNVLPGQIAPVAEALIALETCRDLKKAAYSTPFTSMNQFVQFFQQYPRLVGSGVVLPVNPRVVQEHLGVSTTMVRVEAMGEYRGTRRRITSVIDLGTGEQVYNHIE